MKNSAILVVLAIIAFVLVIGHTNQENKPVLPVSVGFRQALMGPGLVARFQNNSNELLDVRVTFRSSDTNSASSYRLVLPANRVQEVGWAEGWSFVPGERIDLTNNRFKSEEVIVGDDVRYRR